MKTKAWLSAVLLLAAAAAVFWFVLPRTQPATPEIAKDKVVVAQVGDFFIYLPLYYANERGFFERHGLDVSIVESGGDDKSVAAVVAKSADFGVGDPTFAAIARQQGQDVKVIASVVNGVPFWGVARRADIPEIKTPQQLRGLTVATFPKPSTAYVLQEAMFRAGGLPPSIREAQFGSLLPLLDSGQVDVVLELEPNVSTAAANGGKVVYSMASQYPDFAITGVTVLASTIAARPDMVRRFVAALDEAERAAHANPADVITFARKRFPTVPPAVAEAAVRRMLTAGVFPNAARVSQSGWRQALELRVQSGDLRSVAVGAGVIDSRFAR